MTAQAYLFLTLLIVTLLSWSYTEVTRRYHAYRAARLKARAKRHASRAAHRPSRARAAA